MQDPANVPSLADWVATRGLRDLAEIHKESPEARAWVASSSLRDLFLKLYPPAFADSHAAIEIAISHARPHPALVPLLETVPCREGILLVYERVPGGNLGGMETRNRFRSLALEERAAAVTVIYDALASVAAAGYTVVDWYEGNMLYDFERKRIWLFDWDLCRPGDGFTLEMEANYGSSRLMAPEEFVRGSWLDQRTTVFNLARYALLTLPELAGPLAPILARATYPTPAGRYATIAEFAEAFVHALSATGAA